MGWETLLLFAALSAISGYLLRPRPPKQPGPAEFSAPTIEEGVAVPVAFGTCKVAARVAWVGDVGATPITQRVSTGLFTKTTQQIGFSYSAGLQLVVCHGPIDALEDVYFADKPLTEVWSIGLFDQVPPQVSTPMPPVTSAMFPLGVVLNINAPGILGGPDHGGGVRGFVDFYFGTEAQLAAPYLGGQLGVGNVGRYPRLCYAVFQKVTLGNTATPPDVSFLVRRCPKLLTGELDGQPWLIFNPEEDANLHRYADANPAEVIYEILTDRFWGLGLMGDTIDRDSFVATALALHAEHMGVSLLLSDRSRAGDVVHEVLKHIDGVLFESPLTGKLELRLIRHDYTVEQLPRFGRSDLNGITVSRIQWRETVNEVKVTYTSRSHKFNPSTLQLHNLASVQALCEVRPQMYQLPYCTSTYTAARATGRILRAVSIPLAKAQFRTTRKGHALRQGSAFVIEHPKLGVEELVMRVTAIDYGSLDGADIEIEAVEDVFDTSGFDAGSAPPPVGRIDVVDLNDRAVFEAPFYHAGANQRVIVAPVRVSALYTSWEAMTSVGGGAYASQGVFLGWTPCAMSQVHAETGAMSGLNLQVLAIQDMRLLLGRTDILAVVGPELWLVGSVEEAPLGYMLLNVRRAVLDTVPSAIPAYTPIIFYGYGHVSLPEAGEYATGADVAVKMLPINNGVQLPLSAATAESVTIAERSLRPMPPAAVRVNGLGYNAWPSSLAGDVTLSWANRARAQSTIRAQDDVTSETLEGTITVEALIDGAPVRTWAGETGTSITYTIAQRSADAADLTKPVRFRITPVNGALTGAVRTTPAFVMSAP